MYSGDEEGARHRGGVGEGVVDVRLVKRRPNSRTNSLMCFSMVITVQLSRVAGNEKPMKGKDTEGLVTRGSITPLRTSPPPRKKSPRLVKSHSDQIPTFQRSIVNIPTLAASCLHANNGN